MNITRCGSPLGEDEIHCTAKEMKVISNRILPETDLGAKSRKTGIACSCFYDNTKWKFYFCLKKSAEKPAFQTKMRKKGVEKPAFQSKRRKKAQGRRHG